eukprot:m.25048 g.25048  ORF g.25048 m.25048 type:complete len:344 (+) comp5726_c0_seq1:512-1543(+)
MNVIKKFGLGVGKGGNKNNNNHRIDNHDNVNDCVSNEESCNVGTCSRTAANKLLRACPDGTFLIRESISDKGDGHLVFSIIWRSNPGALGDVTHVKIKEWIDEATSKKAYALADVDKFFSLNNLVLHYQHHQQLFCMHFWPREEFPLSAEYPNSFQPFVPSNQSHVSSPVVSSRSSPIHMAKKRVKEPSPQSQPSDHHRFSTIVNPPIELFNKCKMEFRPDGKCSPFAPDKAMLHFFPSVPPRKSLDTEDPVYKMADDESVDNNCTSKFVLSEKSKLIKPTPRNTINSTQTGSQGVSSFRAIQPSNNAKTAHKQGMTENPNDNERIYIEPTPFNGADFVVSKK